VAVDGVGGDKGRQALELLGPGGRLLLYGWSSGSPTALTSMDLFGRWVTASAAIGPGPSQAQGPIRRLEEHAIDALATGVLAPVIGQSFPLARAAEAHRAIESRVTVGKTVLMTGGQL
jgi:NADPH2:quinone reductase